MYAWINSSQVSGNSKVHLMWLLVSLEFHKWEACSLRVKVLWRIFTLRQNQSSSDHLLVLPIHKHSQTNSTAIESALKKKSCVFDKREKKTHCILQICICTLGNPIKIIFKALRKYDKDHKGKITIFSYRNIF